MFPLEMISWTLGIVLIVHAFDIPDWIAAALRNRTRRKELERRLAALEARLERLEQNAKAGSP
ncbi:MAG: hypothetical protein AMXMBFR7_28550 [Planctomycetota bacterium]|nr:hypothetical protein [Planctomycetota bacterium]